MLLPVRGSEVLFWSYWGILFSFFIDLTSCFFFVFSSFHALEFLINTPALSLFATHFKELQSLSQTTDNCFTSYFKFSEDSKTHTRHYSHQLIVGQTPLQDIHYGIEHAEYCHWSNDIVARAKQIRRQLVSYNGNDSTQQSLDKTCNSFTSGLPSLIKQMCMVQNNASSNPNAIPVIRSLLNKCRATTSKRDFECQ